jgi:hypothetical protein
MECQCHAVDPVVGVHSVMGSERSRLHVARGDRLRPLVRFGSLQILTPREDLRCPLFHRASNPLILRREKTR